MANKCGCEPCPVDLAKLFPESRTAWEDPSFKEEACRWHRVAVLPDGKRVSVSGPGKLWVESDNGLRCVPTAESRGWGAYVISVEDAWRISKTQKQKRRRDAKRGA